MNEHYLKVINRQFFVVVYLALCLPVLIRFLFVTWYRTCSQVDKRGFCRLSRIGMNQLITDVSARLTERNLTSLGLLSSDGTSAVLMLPQLENILQRAGDDLKHCSTQSSHGVSTTCSPRGSVDSGGSVFGSYKETVAALRQLLALVRYSRHVRQAITTAHDESSTASKAGHVVPEQVPIDSCCTENNAKWLAVFCVHFTEIICDELSWFFDHYSAQRSAKSFQ